MDAGQVDDSGVADLDVMDPGRPDVDAGVSADASGGDAGLVDGGSTDHGFADATFDDAGGPSDLEPASDVGVSDAGPTLDAGPPADGGPPSGGTDAGLVDTGAPVDAGTVDTGPAGDAGAVDAGMPQGPLVLASNLDGPRDVVVNEAFVYVTVSNASTGQQPPLGTVLRVPKAGGPPVDWDTTTRGVGSLTARSDGLYGLCAFGPICRKPYAGGAVVPNGIGRMGGVTVEFSDFVFIGNAVYAHARLLRVHRTPVGGATAIIASGVNNPSGVYADADYAYWLAAGITGGQVFRAQHDGTQPLAILNVPGFAHDIVVDGQTVWVTDSRRGEVLSGRRDGTQSSVVAQGFDRPTDIEVLGQDVCFAVEAQGAMGKVHCMRSNGTMGRDVITGLSSPRAIHLDAGFVYVIEGTATARLSRAPL